MAADGVTLFLTPSAVSQQLRLLSRDLGVVLLRREGRRVRLTPEAWILLRHTEELYAHWERARAELAAHGNTATGELGVCGLSSVIASLVAQAISRLREQHPRIRVTIREEETADCYELLLAEQSDIAVVLPTADAPAEGDPRFSRQPLLDDPQDLLVPAGHRLAESDSVELYDAAVEPWIVKPQHNDTYPMLMSACAAAGFTPRIVQQAKEWFAVSALVAEGEGVCLLPRLVPVPERHRVVRVPLHGRARPSRRFLTCVRAGSESAPRIAAGLEALRAVATAVRAA